MLTHDKRLLDMLRVSECRSGLANLWLEQLGGSHGELAAAMRYFIPPLAEEDGGRRDTLVDIGTEELSNLEVIGTIVATLTQPAYAARMDEGSSPCRIAPGHVN